VLFALELTDDVDPTAIATVLLALVTLASVLLTMRSLRQTHEEVELSRREVEEAHRPVVVPVIDATRKLRPERSDSPPVGPHIMSNGVLWVPIENIGAGPALDVEVSLELPGVVEGQPVVSGAATGLGVDRVLAVEVRSDHLTRVSDFAIVVTYGDVAGKRWRTDAGYVASDRRYDDISIGPNESQGGTHLQPGI
jgi:hypothetical protein